MRSQPGEIHAFENKRIEEIASRVKSGIDETKHSSCVMNKQECAIVEPNDQLDYGA